MAVTAFNRTQSRYTGTKLTWYKTQAGWKSKPRTETPLAFSMDTRKTVFVKWGGADFRQDCNTTRAVTEYSNSKTTSLRNATYNRAYEKFRSAVYKSAEMGVLAAERREAMSLVSKRCVDLYVGFNFLRKGDFWNFLRHFNLLEKHKNDKRRWTKPVNASAIWLEYWFGWAPLVADIYSAIDVLQGEPPPVRARAGARMQSQWHTQISSGRSLEYWTTTVTARCHLQADFKISNPNLFLANQLGLLNPASIAWELVPFSFVVDWFYPIGNFLRSWSDWFGLSVSRPITSQICAVSTDSSLTYWNSTVGVGPIQGYTNQKSERAVFTRTLNLNQPVRPIFHFEGLSATRALTSVSLLITTFLKGR